MRHADIIHRTLGLSDTEKAVMRSLSSSKNVQAIASETHISRTGINYCLASLSNRGFIRVIRDAKKKTYIALTPDELTDFLEETIGKIRRSKTIRKGARIKTTKEDEFIIHVGASEIIPAYERIAKESRDERIKAIQHHRSYNELLDKISPKQLVAFNEAIKKNRIIIDGILNESAYKDYAEEIRTNRKKFAAASKSLEGRMADYGVFTDKYFNHDAELWLFKNTSLLINWHDEVAIEITNRSMTAFLKDMFEFVKKESQKIDHNKAMRDILTT